MRMWCLAAVVLLACQTTGGTSAKPATTTSSEAEKHAGPNLAFVLLEKDAALDAKRISEAFRRFSASGPGLRPDPESTEGLLFAFGDGGFLLLKPLPMAVPDGEADAAFENSLSRLQVEDGRLPPHRAHVAAFFKDEEGRSRRDGLIRFTQLLAAVAEASEAVGIYWGNAGATHLREFFVKVASEEDPSLLITLWTGVEVVEDGPSRVSILSLGMEEQLGLMDLRMTAPRSDVGGAVGRLYDMLSYNAQRGTNIPEGDTVGAAADERLPVKYEPHPVDKSITVWRVDVP